MFSEEFMRYLIKYQSKEKKDTLKAKEKNSCQVKYFGFSLKNRIAATVLQTCNR